MAHSRRCKGCKRWGQQLYCDRCKRIRYQYGLDPHAVARLERAQGGKCAICGRPPKQRVLMVDQDPITGHLRGLLCKGCNNGLGYLRTKVLLISALRYLNKPQTAAPRVTALVPRTDAEMTARHYNNETWGLRAKARGLAQEAGITVAAATSRLRRYAEHSDRSGHPSRVPLPTS